MQIYEIARRPVGEGILKGVANTVKGVGRAGLNTAEYFANKVLDAAGVPAAQQGKYSKYGHIAASQGQGIASINRQEQYIANELAKEWSYSQTLNGRLTPDLDPQSIKQAATAYNAGSNLQIDTDKIADTVQALAPRYVQDRKAQQVSKAQSRLEIKNLMAELEKQFAASKDSKVSPAEQQQARDLKNKIINQLQQMGQSVDKKYMDDTAQTARSAVSQHAGAPAIAAPPTVSAPSPAAAPKPPAVAAAPVGYNYANVMKMPGMPAPAKKPAPVAAESLTWSTDFDPSRSLFKKMKLEQAQ